MDKCTESDTISGGIEERFDGNGGVTGMSAIETPTPEHTANDKDRLARTEKNEAAPEAAANNQNRLARTAKSEARRLARLQKKAAEAERAAALAAQQAADDRRFMKAALTQAQKALALGETPIGCVIVRDGRIIARGYNRRNTDRSALAHAELTAIRRASRAVGDWRLEGCTLYVTLEPCQMCAGAIVQARADRVVIGAPSLKSGCGGTLLNILQNPAFNHQAAVTRGVMADECAAVLRTFFRALREKNRADKKKNGAPFA